MKEMTSVASTMMTDEDRAELEKQMSTPSAPSVTATPHVDPTPAAGPAAAGASTPSAAGASTPSGSPPPTASDSTADLSKADKERKKRSRLSPEQRKKLDDMDVERKKAMEERITTLTGQLKERLRPFVDAKHPGDKDDSETLTFESKMRREAEDMKLESFGVEVSAFYFCVNLSLSSFSAFAHHRFDIYNESYVFPQVEKVPWNVRTPVLSTRYAY